MAELHPGDAAPAFRATDQNGSAFDSSSLRGTRHVLYFFPQADTPG